jgi:hypothetical protein
MKNDRAQHLAVLVVGAGLSVAEANNLTLRERNAIFKFMNGGK